MFNTIKSIFRNVTEKNNIIARPKTAKAGKKSFYDLTIKNLTGKKDISFADFKGKKVLIINTASKCGYTPQYEDWQKFHEKFGDKVVVIGMPANNFLAQESGSASEIEEFCQVNYGVSFTITEKVSVSGKDKHPIYQWLSDENKNGWNNIEPSWNFCKYLINEKGELTHFFGSAVKPENPSFKQALAF